MVIKTSNSKEKSYLSLPLKSPIGGSSLARILRNRGFPSHLRSSERAFPFSTGKVNPFTLSNNGMEALINLWLKDILTHGAHIGHKPLKLPVSRVWKSCMSEYLLGSRNKVATINSHFALEGAAKGLYLSSGILRKRGHILIIDTRGDVSPFSSLIENNNHLIPISLSFSGSRWMGGSLTNWDSISVMVRRCAQISEQFDAFLVQNRIHIPSYEKMRQAFPGFIKMNPVIAGRVLPASPSRKEGRCLLSFHETRLRFKRRPDLIWLLNPNENRHIIEEARTLGIPIIGVVDSNTNLSNITIPIPININGSFWPNKLITILLVLSKFLAASKGFTK